MVTDARTRPAQDAATAIPYPEPNALELDTSPTHKVCEAVHFDTRLRRQLLDALRFPYRAWPPNYGLDTTAVMRHAWQAHRWQRGRDVALCSIEFLTAVAVALGLIDRGGLPLLIAAVVLVAMTVLIRRVLRWRRVTVRKAITWSRRLIRRHLRQSAVALIFLAALSIVALPAAAQLVRPSDLLLPLGGAAAILIVGMLDAIVVARRANRCRGSTTRDETPGLLRDAAPPLPAIFEERLRTIDDGPDPDQSTTHADGRVIPYNLAERESRTSIDNGFVGSGYSVGDRQINVDVSAGRLEIDGTRRKPKDVSLVGVHRALERAFRAAASPGMWCGYRMYVDDRSLHRDSSLLPDPHAGPISRRPLPDHLLYLREPTALKRTHLCVQVPLPRWHGEIIVTLFIRGDLTTHHLTLHNDLLILPDVALRRRWPRGYPPTDLWTYLTCAFHAGCVRIWREAVLGPARFLGEARGKATRTAHRWRMRREIKHRRVPRYGAISSIREDLAVGSLVVHPNAVQDIDGVIASLLHTLKAGLKAYLEDLDIDASAIDDEVRNVINYQQHKIDQLNAKNVTFGAKSRAGDSGEKPTPPSDKSR